MNLEVEHSTVEALAKEAAVLVEDLSQTIYPVGQEHIPKKRQEYSYYAATAQFGSVSEVVLVRRAKLPVSGRVELFAARKLRTALGVKDGDVLAVALYPRQSQIRTHSGTLVMVLTTSDGLLFCADRMVSDREGAAFSNVKKVEVIDNRFVFAVTGMSVIENVNANKATRFFDVQEITRRYFAKVNNVVDCNEYRRTLGQQIWEGLNRMPFQHWPSTPPGSLCEVVVGWVSSDGPYLDITSVGYEKRNPLQLQMRGNAHDRETLTIINAIVAGRTEVWNEILRGSDSQFDDLRQNRAVRVFADGNRLLSEVTVDDATEFATLIFAATRERTPLLRAGPVGVGVECDYVHLTASGPKWINLRFGV